MMFDGGELHALLEDREVALWANMVALAFATELAHAVIRRSGAPVDARRALSAECSRFRSIPPEQLDESLVDSWLRQALAEEVTYRFKTMADLDVQGFWALLVVCAASCQVGRFDQSVIGRNLDVMVKDLVRQGRRPV